MKTLKYAFISLMLFLNIGALADTQNLPSEDTKCETNTTKSIFEHSYSEVFAEIDSFNCSWWEKMKVRFVLWLVYLIVIGPGIAVGLVLISMVIPRSYH